MNKTAVLIGLGAMLLASAGAVGWLNSPPEGEPNAAPAGLGGGLPIPPLPTRLPVSERYDRCLSAVNDDPSRAMADADSWWRETGEVAARHCLALAELGLGRAAAAAALLEALADTAATPLLAPVRATMFDQASQAWLLAGRLEAAYAAASKAVALAPDNPDLWLDRAAVAVAQLRYQPAIDDFTQAYQRDTSRTDILVRRAATFRMLGRLEAAGGDVARVLAADPDNAEALLERGVLRQRAEDVEGARGDWERVIAVAPDSQTADLATQDLALLDAGPIR